jgi:hypothetical protein
MGVVLVKNWEKAFVAYYKASTWNVPGGTREMNTELESGRWSHASAWNEESTKYEFKEHGDCMKYFLITYDYCDFDMLNFHGGML